MAHDNCIDTIPGMRLTAPASVSLTWRGWLHDGKHLVAREAGQFMRGLRVCLRRRRSRRDLAALDARLLADIGLTHEQAKREMRKPFWKE